jgi:GNAT superfamily N-acetyltransferase
LHRSKTKYAFMALLRVLLPTEAGQLTEHLLRLTPEERASRFMHIASDEVVRAHVATFKWRSGVVIGFFEAGVLRGAAEIQGIPFGACEVAVTVEHVWQQQGIGTELVRQALLVARNRMFHSVQVICLGTNQAFQHIARKFTDHLNREDGEASSEIRLAPPTWLSLVQEAANNGLGWMSGLMPVERPAA